MYQTSNLYVNPMKLFSLQNKATVIFGGTGYPGKSIVQAMLDHDGKVVVADVNEQIFDAPDFAEIKAHPNCIFIKCDVQKTDDIRAAYTTAEVIVCDSGWTRW